MKINHNDIDLDNLDYIEALEEETVIAKKTKKTKKNKEVEPMIEETIVTVEEETTTTTDENKEDNEMTTETTKEPMKRVINQITLEKVKGVYDWKYTKFEAVCPSIASSKKEYNDQIEYSLTWSSNPDEVIEDNEIPEFLKIAPSDKNNKDFVAILGNVVFSLNNRIPEAVRGKDGKVKIAVFASQGGVKSGERYFADPDFVDMYKNEGSMVEYSADPLMEQYRNLRREISVKEFDLIPLYLNSVGNEELLEELNARKAELDTMFHNLRTLRKSMTCGCINDAFGAPQSNQVTAFFWTPCKKKGVPMNVKIMNEVKVKVACEGYVDTRDGKSWKVQDKMNGEDPYMEISIDDGSAFVDKEYAKKHGFFGGEVKDMTQARSGIGYQDGVMTDIALDFKGTIQVMDMPEGMDDAIYVSESSAKGLKRFSKEVIENCSYQFYTMDRNIHTDGIVKMGPQVAQYGLTQATDEEMEKLTANQVKELNELKTEAGYKKLVAKMTKTSYWTTNWNRIGSAPYGRNLEGKLVGATVKMDHDGECSFERKTSILEHKAFEGLAYSSMFTYSAAKQATDMYNRLGSGAIYVEGASAKAQGDVVAILRNYKAQFENKTVTIEEIAHIPADNVIVPQEWKEKFHLKKGQKLFIWRNPYNATIGCIVTIFGFSKVRDTIQLSALDNNSHKLASDNDGDTIYASWNETVISVFEKANAFAKKCGARVLAYRTGEEDKTQRGIPADEYLAFAPANGAVGLVCEPLFGLVSLIPVGCQNPDEVLFSIKMAFTNDNGEKYWEDIVVTPKLIYRLLDHGFVGTTYTIDSAKKHYANAYGRTKETKMIKGVVGKGIYWTKVFYHPTKVDYDPETDMINRNGLLVPRIGGNGGLAVMAKKALNKVWPNPTDNGVIMDYTDILDGYEYGTIEGGNDTTKGFVYCPKDAFTGVDKDVFFKKTNFDEVNDELDEGGVFLDMPVFTERNNVCGDKTLTGNAFRSWLIMGMAERDVDMDESEKIKSVSLASWSGHDLTIGVLRARLLRACNNLTVFDGWYNNKGDARKGVDERMIEVIKLWVNVYCEKEECTEEEAWDILYDEVATFLFSGKADEAYAPDIQSFLGNRKFVDRLFAQEKIWLKEKIKTGEVDYKKLTPFEKDLVIDKIVMNTVNKTKKK